MTSRDERPGRQQDAHSPGDDDAPQSRKDWQDPKLTFIEPTLTPHGALTSVTGQFFGAFSPPPES